MADVLVLRSARSDATSTADAPSRAPSQAASSTPDDGSPAATWLPALLGDHYEKETVDDAEHRYRGARLLYTSGCRYVDVTASPVDPTSVRLTVVWDRQAPSAEERAAFLSWWTTRARDLGWRLRDEDEVVGEVVLERFVPTEQWLDTQTPPPVVEHDWVRVTGDGSSSRTSGRRT